jgi:hypothetical protein
VWIFILDFNEMSDFYFTFEAVLTGIYMTENVAEFHNKISNNGVRLPLTSGFTQAGVYARPNFYANLQVHRPPKPL